MARMFILGRRAALDPDGSLRWAAMVGPAGAQLRADSSGQQRALLLPSRSQRRAISPRREASRCSSWLDRGVVEVNPPLGAAYCHADNHQRAIDLLFPVRDQVRRPDAARESLARPFSCRARFWPPCRWHRDVATSPKAAGHIRPKEAGARLIRYAKRRPRRIGRRPAGRQLC